MSDTRQNTRHLTNVSEAQVDAMRALDPDTLSGLVTMVYLLTTDEDVREHAGIIVASLYAGANDGQHAARAAVRIAQRAVTASRTLDRWDMYGDLTEEVVTDWRETGVDSHVARYAPDPATEYAPTVRDLVTTLANTYGMRTACEAYLSHARTCEACTGADSHRVTLAGVRAHLDGRGADDASYHSERRAMLRTLASVGTFSDLARLIGDDAPLAAPHPTHGSVSLGSIRKESTRDQVAPVRTVIHNGTPRTMTHAERDALTATTERAARYDGESYSGGTHAPVSGQADAFGYAQRADANTGRATTPGDALPSGKVEPSPRKRPRTGSTGPTVPIW